MPADSSICCNPYRLDVLTPNLTDVLAEAGGWIIDRALAGWAVTIICIGPGSPGEDRLGKILGAEIAGREALTDGNRFRPYGIALPAALYRADNCARDYIAASLAHQATEICLFGTGRRAPTDDTFQSISHRISTAARAFKAHSLAAAYLPNDGLPANEYFHSAVLPRSVADATRRARGESTRVELGPELVIGLPRDTPTGSRNLFALKGLRAGK